MLSKHRAPLREKPEKCRSLLFDVILDEDSYLLGDERTDSEIAKTASEYDAKLKAALDEIEKKAQAVSDTLDEQSKANREKWAQELADRAVNAD